MYQIKNVKLAGAIFSALFLSAANVSAAPKGVDVTIPITPIVAGTATVDGDHSEWDISADFAANMCTAGSLGEDRNCEGKGKENLSDLYLRYDCNKDILYVLVLEQDGYQAERSAGDAWVTIGGNSNKVVNGSSVNDNTQPNFAWVESDGELLGYEASFKLAAGTHDNVQVHLNVSGNTSSTGKNGDTIQIIVPETCEMPEVTPPQSTTGCDYIYGVDDKGLNDSQLLRYKAGSGTESLGGLLAGYDIEALDISPKGVLYGASGNDTDQPAYLYTINMDTGAILSGNPTGCTELNGISFNPSNGSLWGWDQAKGLVQIIDGNCSTGVTSQNPGIEVEDMSWNNAGDTIYFAYNNHNGADPDGSDAKATHHIGSASAAGSVDWNVCDIQAGEIEALEVLNDGTLLVGSHQNGRQLTTVFDLQTCQMIGGGETAAYDIEGLAACPPEA